MHPEGVNKGSKRGFRLPAKICALVLDSARLMSVVDFLESYSVTIGILAGNQ